MAHPKLYSELASWFHLLTTPADYAEEAEFYRKTLIEASTQPPRTVLELGSGGGNNASHLKASFELTLVDRSPGMLAVSRELNPEKTVWEEISGGEDEVTLGTRTVASRAYCSWFNFKGRDQQRTVGELSGGERNRVHLAKLLRTGANVLLLDEPTNDLDVDTLRALEDALLEFAGCVVVISHDRWFLDRITTHILAFEGESQAVWFQGNYQDYEADRRRRFGSAADRPHRIKYRRLTRA